jgi:hypothetical protein
MVHKTFVSRCAGIFVAALVASLLVLSSSGTESAQAHARCDGKDHYHWAWSVGYNDRYIGSIGSTVHLRFRPDYYWAYAYNPRTRETDWKRCW